MPVPGTLTRISSLERKRKRNKYLRASAEELAAIEQLQSAPPQNKYMCGENESQVQQQNCEDNIYMYMSHEELDKVLPAAALSKAISDTNMYVSQEELDKAVPALSEANRDAAGMYVSQEELDQPTWSADPAKSVTATKSLSCKCLSSQVNTNDSKIDSRSDTKAAAIATPGDTPEHTTIVGYGNRDDEDNKRDLLLFNAQQQATKQQHTATVLAEETDDHASSTKKALGDACTAAAITPQVDKTEETDGTVMAARPREKNGAYTGHGRQQSSNFAPSKSPHTMPRSMGFTNLQLPAVEASTSTGDEEDAIYECMNATYDKFISKKGGGSTGIDTTVNGGNRPTVTSSLGRHKNTRDTSKTSKSRSTRSGRSMDGSKDGSGGQKKLKKSEAKEALPPVNTTRHAIPKVSGSTATYACSLDSSPAAASDEKDQEQGVHVDDGCIYENMTMATNLQEDVYEDMATCLSTDNIYMCMDIDTNTQTQLSLEGQEKTVYMNLSPAQDTYTLDGHGAASENCPQSTKSAELEEQQALCDGTKTSMDNLLQFDPLALNPNTTSVDISASDAGYAMEQNSAYSYHLELRNSHEGTDTDGGGGGQQAKAKASPTTGRVHSMKTSTSTACDRDGQAGGRTRGKEGKDATSPEAHQQQSQPMKMTANKAYAYHLEPAKDSYGDGPTTHDRKGGGRMNQRGREDSAGTGGGMEDMHVATAPLAVALHPHHQAKPKPKPKPKTRPGRQV